MQRGRLAKLIAPTVLAATVACASSGTLTNQSAPAKPTVETIRVALPSGDGTVDIYWPASDWPAPLVIVAHGFSRHRNNMSAWGRHLAEAGLVAAVPNLPAWSDQARNGRFISDLQAYLCARLSWRQRIDPSRIGLMGFSAGGLATLLAAAAAQDVAIWVGLDPVDRNGLGAKAAPLVKCRTVVLTAEPSSCNARGNSRGIIAALPHAEHTSIAGAVHVDAEEPTDWKAELVCGRSTDTKREDFRRRATAALLETLARPPASVAARRSPQPQQQALPRSPHP